MPVVISLFNAFTGLAVGFEGFVMGIPALIIAGIVVGAAGTLLLANALGCVLGPSLAALAMEGVGPRGLPIYLLCVHLGLGAFALWRMTRRSAPPLAAQGPTVFISPTAASVAQEERQETARAARAGA